MACQLQELSINLKNHTFPTSVITLPQTIASQIKMYSNTAAYLL